MLDLDDDGIAELVILGPPPEAPQADPDRVSMYGFALLYDVFEASGASVTLCTGASFHGSTHHINDINDINDYLYIDLLARQQCPKALALMCALAEHRKTLPHIRETICDQIEERGRIERFTESERRRHGGLCK